MGDAAERDRDPVEGHGIAVIHVDRVVEAGRRCPGEDQDHGEQEQADHHAIQEFPSGPGAARSRTWVHPLFQDGGKGWSLGPLPAV
jgi:hypothetical protein